MQRVDTADIDYQYMEYAPILNQGYTAAFIELQALDDQTITGNPHFGLLGRCGTAVEIMGKREIHSYTGAGSPAAGIEGRGCLNMFKPPKGTFFLCFDLDTFQNHGDIARSGTTIVNNQVYLRARDMLMAQHTVTGTVRSMHVTCLYQHDARIVFEAQGNVYSLY